MRIYLLLAAATGLSFIGSNCGGSGVGDPCVPEDEYLTAFSGFALSEVNVESRSFQCQTRVCLANHFQGRVSCPYGQRESSTAEGLAKCMGTLEDRNSPACQPGGLEHTASCQVPSRDGSRWDDRIHAPVTPQYADRPAADAVYCSCRCSDEDGGTSGGKFCECPTGYDCTQLVDDLGLGKGQLAGGYCVLAGTAYDPAEKPVEPCDADSANCGVKKGDEGDTGRYWEYMDGTLPQGRNQRDACLPSGAVCGDEDQCCSSEPTACDDTEGGNCFGECVNGLCQHMDNDGNPIPGATEQIYEVTRTDCKKDDVCP